MTKKLRKSSILVELLVLVYDGVTPFEAAKLGPIIVDRLETFNLSFLLKSVFKNLPKIIQTVLEHWDRSWMRKKIPNLMAKILKLIKKHLNCVVIWIQT